MYSTNLYQYAIKHPSPLASRLIDEMDNGEDSAVIERLAIDYVNDQLAKSLITHTQADSLLSYYQRQADVESDVDSTEFFSVGSIDN